MLFVLILQSLHKIHKSVEMPEYNARLGAYTFIANAIHNSFPYAEFRLARQQALLFDFDIPSYLLNSPEISTNKDELNEVSICIFI